MSHRPIKMQKILAVLILFGTLHANFGNHRVNILIQSSSFSFINSVPHRCSQRAIWYGHATGCEYRCVPHACWGQVYNGFGPYSQPWRDTWQWLLYSGDAPYPKFLLLVDFHFCHSIFSQCVVVELTKTDTNFFICFFFLPISLCFLFQPWHRIFSESLHWKFQVGTNGIRVDFMLMGHLIVALT